mgnify:CR=1 FL=1
MEGLVHTDLGLLSKDNANWLYSQNVINEEGFLKNVPVSGITRKRVQLYSYLRWVMDDIRSKIPAIPQGIGFGANELIELMRVGEIELEDYSAHYSKVSSIVESGKKAFVGNQPKSKKDIDLDGWDI